MSLLQSTANAVRRSASCLFGLSWLAGLMMLTTGCADSRGGPIPYDVASFGKPDSTTAATLGADYKIAPMDTLAVTVFRLPDLSGDYTVDLTGQISLPLIGEVAAADRTPAELDRILTERLGEKYLQNPDVSVGIKSSAGRLVTVDGAVAKAGSYPVLGPLTLIQAVALAGGAEEQANLRRVAVFRQIGGARQAAAFDLVGIRRGEAPDPKIYPGDVVIVDGSSIKEAQKRILNALPILSVFRPF